MNSSHVEFPCGTLDERISLEGELHLPQGDGPFPGVVVCHPHPLYGGNMFNNVVVAICETLSRNSIAALRFNFRGVDSSGGEFGGGITEQEDVKAALDFLSATPGIDTGRIGLAGYSFGAGVASVVAPREERVNLLALVSPALSDAAWEQLKQSRKAKFLIVGDGDSVIPLERFQHQIADIADPMQYRVVPGVDHFWLGYEGEVARQVAGFFTSGFNQV